MLAEPKKMKPCSFIAQNHAPIEPSRTSIACGRSALEQMAWPGSGSGSGALVMKAAMNSKAASTMPSRKTTSSPGSSGASPSGSSDLTKNSHRKLTTKMVHVMANEVRVMRPRPSIRFSTRKPAPE